MENSISHPAAEPIRQPPSLDWTHYGIYSRIEEAIYSIPAYFKSETNIEGIRATDIFTLNAALSATIEEQVVSTLNHMRDVWDPEDEYAKYSFARQSQTFPDVIFKPGDPKSEIIMGIELKGWYLLAKEGVPSFRFQVTKNACNLQDLIVVVPWVLSNVVSGSPKVFRPYVEHARYAAEYRNYHWEHLRDARSSTEIEEPPNVHPYPTKSDQIADKPKSDSGGNFGRFARTGLMDEYIESLMSESVCGIEALYWLQFFKLFQDRTDRKTIEEGIDSLSSKIEVSDIQESEIKDVMAALRVLKRSLDRI